jgi:hypothetical protein
MISRGNQIRPSRPVAVMPARRSKALIVANHFLETDREKLKAAASTGYARGKLFETLPHERYRG